jgi:hypothetical protein
MSRKMQTSNRTDAPSRGPIKAGSPLYRLLQLIAREVAKVLENKSSSNKQQTGKR